MMNPQWTETRNGVGEKGMSFKGNLTIYSQPVSHLLWIFQAPILYLCGLALLMWALPSCHQPACLPVRQLPIPPPWRPNILALHKFLMSVLKSLATSTHRSLNLLRQTNIIAYTCFCTFLAALTSHMRHSEGRSLRCWRQKGCGCQQLQASSFLSKGQEDTVGTPLDSCGGHFIDRQSRDAETWTLIVFITLAIWEFQWRLKHWGITLPVCE